MPRKQTIAIDFDGVLHQYVTPWVAADVIPDPPVPGAIAALRRYSEYFKIAILSTRNYQEGAVEAMQGWLLRNGLERRVVDQILFPIHKVPAIVYIDDRAYRFEGTWPLVGVLKGLKPWNKS